MKKIINNYPEGYAELRNIVKENSDNFLRVKDIFQYGLHLYRKLTKKGYHPFFKGMFYYPLLRNHKAQFFNTINLGPQYWDVYFETTLPRLGDAPKWLEYFCVKKLASNKCENLYAISECAKKLQVVKIENQYPKFASKIIPKISVKYPPQKKLIKSYNDKNLSHDKIIFTIIGSDFFRKGGREILRVFNDLIPIHPELHLNIISTLNYGDYASKTTVKDYNNATAIIANYSNNITHYTKLPNKHVLELLINSHVGLLPTWGDSFGYSVLEAQAAGCPVITTNIRALPEINSDEIGWVIKLNLDKNLNPIIDDNIERESVSNIISENLKKILIDIVSDKTIIKQKAELLINEK
jgi:glycosyltransferase involved in cell wall biosynthesis